MTIIRTDRKTIAIQIRPDGEVVVRCPRRMSETAVMAFVRSKREWIEKNLAKQRTVPQLPVFTQQELNSLAQQAKNYLPGRVAYFAGLLHVSVGRITIRAQRSRWGSCSGKGNLNFNCLLMLIPPEVADYIVVHELCHRKEMNHSPRFWAEVERILPDYKQRQQWLKEQGTALIRRLNAKT